MVILKDIYSSINNLANEQLAEKWDNVGILIGDENQTIKKILICLDVTNDVVDEAVSKGVDLIIAHHPLIFKPIKKLNFNNFKNKIIRSIIKNDISVIAAHTNLDSAKLGLNDYLAKLLKLENTEVLIPNSLNHEEGLGRIGYLKNELPLNEFNNYVKKQLNLDFTRIVAKNKTQSIKRVAILGGSGGSFIYDLPEVDVYLTGDIGYHEAVDALEMGISLIDIGHFAEKASKELLREYLTTLEYTNLEIIISKVEKEPFELG
ncbi:Nif3-like dinuclear metal center hexameric protein [Gemelliphila palaticanis]|uniref:GTP cyclohydrolase 1 type 2 homolog n=1 Tax=Gemelliphila palaticanis TaxID=81950 RepID=A0ABX2T3F4_9BACL|nr:Nif3-like dinuclear metal center hexameric protein [Gemella palaticanis]MBF0715616.1 Nif3-like dinuclear metal center hexameric protein [Gemella palaticanis]NYS47546.1 Nif3-like dinuclear metal center hexameric protein [Gemella palaticanis]